MSEIEDYVAFGEYRIVIKMFGLNSRKEEIQQLDQPDNAIVTVCASRFARYAQTAPITHCRLSKCWIDPAGGRE